MESTWASLLLTWDPMVWRWEGLALSWYGLAFAWGLLATTGWFLRKFKQRCPQYSNEETWDIVLVILLGALVGARLGFVFGYGELSVYFAEPWRIISPYDFVQHTWTGIRGMSFFGGVLGGGYSLFWYTKRRARSFLEIADVLALALPIGLGFGRIGNFLNQELFGRITTVPWGMYFPVDPLIRRHPSQLYEAVGEGVVLFWLLHWLSQKPREKGWLGGVFLIAYGGMRFLLEFLRAPDRDVTLLFHFFTLNQAFSLLFFLGGGIFLLILRGRGTIETSKKNL